jgi:hypothetical protein
MNMFNKLYNRCAHEYYHNGILVRLAGVRHSHEAADPEP